MTIEILEEARVFEGRQLRIKHVSASCHCDMVFSVFLPPQIEQQAVPVLWWLSGLTCNDQNFVTKAGAQRVAAELGIAVIAPDTSPRGEGVPDDSEGAWDFGLGAGFYVNATQAPFDQYYRMYEYIQQELPALVQNEFNLDLSRQGIFGHSMGGHGALTLALNNPQQYRSVSAFAPICAPSQCAWGQKALAAYLGDDRAAWQAHDAVALIESRGFDKPILVDQGLADSFLENQLKPELLHAACAKQSVSLTLNHRAGYDHSYYFISTFMEEHLRYHSAFLNR
ncbi:S-formylglutathione hydrolase [Ketobacter sp. MCCC 1A13808]|uniref:S-formylglutathione hydrolase n=1 Tax=Ketobacter sp. MCCC 1A13808 TaxID=2602738 RepID=UPI000F10CFBC|nr:S-formylglutathione hydrolase [Ketobacter sp. MCCC 1A13808]MVF11272.1 S-formylglutathione hydrolase [Ketobacter sp. MCCC 1A13808]RLP53597.1 MAG: S-formylglutathione hydrolase [Ketobacter sp.]